MDCLDTCACGKYTSPDEQDVDTWNHTILSPPCDHHLAVATDEFPEYDHFFWRATANEFSSPYHSFL